MHCFMREHASHFLTVIACTRKEMLLKAKSDVRVAVMHEHA